jgi:nucleotide-binding universal stress UspA family protein
MYAPDVGTYIDPLWDDESQASAQRYVDGLAARLQEAGVRAEGRALVGDVAATIAQTAAQVDADLIVMSTHALTGPARAVLGSVADEVVRIAHHPVLLVQREHGRDPGTEPAGGSAAEESAAAIRAT